jgi:hypothetical protein
MEAAEAKKRVHRVKQARPAPPHPQKLTSLQAGPKAQRKKAKDFKKRNVDQTGHKNIRVCLRARAGNRALRAHAEWAQAFTYASVVRANRSKQRNVDRAHRKEHAPIVNRNSGACAARSSCAEQLVTRQPRA